MPSQLAAPSRLPTGAVLVALVLLFGFCGVAGQTSESGSLGAFFDPSMRWRVINDDTVLAGWAVGELRFYADPGCSDELTIVPSSDSDATAETSDRQVQAFEASGSHLDAVPDRAFDKQTWTEWRSGCYLCEPGEAWLAVQFAGPVSVYCMEIWQRGKGDYRTASLGLERWEATTSSWQRVLTGSGLEGSRWDKVQFVKCEELEVPEHGRVEVSNGGFYPSEAKFSCGGAHILSGFSTSSCDASGKWSDFGASARRCWTLMEILIFVSTVIAIEILLFGSYYYCVMVPRDATLTMTSFIPEDLHRQWTTEFIFEAREEAAPQMRCFLACPCCRLADTWRAAGLLPYHFGALVTQFFCIFTPCIGAYFRGLIRDRFVIPGTRTADLLQWICCLPFAAAQEAKQMEDVCHASFHEEEAMRKEAGRKADIERKQKEEDEAEKQGRKAEGDSAGKALQDLTSAIGKPTGRASKERAHVHREHTRKTSVLQGCFEFKA